MGVISEVKKKKLYSFIKQKNKFFEIPCFQRNYSWDKKQCQELYEDILNSYETGKSHYLGNLLYYVSENDSDKLILIDGQQRLTSIFLMLCAIRDVYPDKLLKIDEEFLYESKNEGNYKIKIKENFIDADFFERIILKKVDNELLKAKSKIVENYMYFKEIFLSNQELDIKKFYNEIKNLEIVEIQLESEKLELIQVVFEKINSAGKPLSGADLIRNLLLLSNDIKEQKRLYKDYWVILEKIINDEASISQFSRNYLVLKTYKQIDKDKIYSEFKEYYYKSNISAEKILQEMLEYSKYFSIIKTYDYITEINYKELEPHKKNINLYTNEHDTKLEKNYHELYFNLTLLNAIGTDEQYPFYLQLFNKLYDNKLEELNKILNLVIDFIIRYRIVGVSGGGGALSSFIREIMQKIETKKINCSYEDILFEFSNSPTRTSAFPSDLEFKKVLETKVDNALAKWLLYKLEYKSTKNMPPIKIKDIEIEHLMPQTLDSKDWWKKHLAENKKNIDEASREVHETYLNCIGNLALISPGYNKENSNKPWDIKREVLKNVQFSYTNKCSLSKNWRKREICNRNEFLIDKICKNTISPLERTRPYKNSNTENFNIYKFNSLNEKEFYYKKPLTIMYGDKTKAISAWKDVISTIFEINPDINLEKLERLIDKNIVHKNTKTYVDDKLEYDPVLSKNSKYLYSPIEINVKELKFYVEGSLSSERVLTYTKAILKYLNLLSKYSIEIE